MPDSSDKLLVGAVSVFAACGIVAVAMAGFSGAPEPPLPRDLGPDPVPPVSDAPVEVGAVESAPLDATDEAAAWFAEARPHCNAAAIDRWSLDHPAPESIEGSMYGAACLALAGRASIAREVIRGLPEDRQGEAAGLLFQIGHPAADAGDEIAAGPLMEVVVDFWPANYMALYHAGAARYERGDAAGAKPYLERFLNEYAQEDGWRSNAIRMLEAAGGRPF